jgi:hydrogenase maturation protease
MKNNILVLGIGNLLMGDEGVGVHFAQQFQEKAPEEVDVLDGGTGGFHLMSYFEAYPTLIMVDATLDSDRPPGTIRLIEPRFSKDFPRAMSTHDIGLKDLIEGLSILGRLPQIYLFVVSIKELQEMEIGLTAAVQAAMPELEARVRELIKKIA